MIEIIMQFETLAEAQDALARIAGDSVPTATAVAVAGPATDAPVDAAKPRGRKAKPEKVETVAALDPGHDVPQPTPAEAGAQMHAAARVEITPTAEVVAQAAGISYDADVKPLIPKVSAAVGVPAVVALLKEYGAAKGSEVPAAKLADFKARLEQMLEPAAESVL